MTPPPFTGRGAGNSFHFCGRRTLCRASLLPVSLAFQAGRLRRRTPPHYDILRSKRGAPTTNKTQLTGLLAHSITPRSIRVQCRTPHFQYNRVPLHRPHHQGYNDVPATNKPRSADIRASPSLPCEVPHFRSIRVSGRPTKRTSTRRAASTAFRFRRPRRPPGSILRRSAVVHPSAALY